MSPGEREAGGDPYRTRLGALRGVVRRRGPVVRGRRSGGPLDRDQLDAFEHDGFVVIEGLLDRAEVSAVLDEAERLASPGACDPSRLVLEPGGAEVRSVFEVHRSSPVVAAVVADPRVAGLARQVLGSEVYVHQSRVNRKAGFTGRGFGWHSDFETWHAEDGMPEPRALSISIALTPNDVCNGSLMIIPGSHRTFVPTVGDTPSDHYRQSLRRQEVGVPDEGSLTRLVAASGGITTVTGGIGSVVLFDCNAMHGSTENITPFPRCNLFVVYNSTENVLAEPYAAPGQRPEFVASRDFTPVG